MNSILVDAVYNNFALKDVQALINSGARIEGKATTGRTALMAAIACGKVGIFYALLKAGASVHARDNTGWTPLHWAALKDNLRFAKALVERGADVHATSTQGRAPADLAPTRSNTLEYLEGQARG